MRAKAMFYISAAILMLTLAYHFGATTATAQVGVSNPVVAAGGNDIVFTANGDVYVHSGAGWNDWYLGGNVFGIGPTPAQPSSFGAVKARYR